MQKTFATQRRQRTFLRYHFVNVQIDGRLRCLSILLGSICIPTVPLIKTPSIYIAYALYEHESNKWAPKIPAVYLYTAYIIIY